MMIKKNFCVGTVMVALLLSSFGVCASHSSYDNFRRLPIKWEGYLQGEDITNGIGGIKRGSVVNGNGLIAGVYDLRNFRSNYRGKVKLGVLGATHTRNQNEYTGAIQSPSYYTSQREVRLSNLSYQYDYKNSLTTIIGIMDMSDYFNITEASQNLMNTAFTNTMAFAANTQMASYPYPGFGAAAVYRKNCNEAMIGLYQGAPQHQWSVFHEGYMVVGEVGHTFFPRYYFLRDFSLNLGGWTYQQSNRDIGYNSRGLYVTVQADIQLDPEIGFEVFGQFGYSDEKPKYIPYSATAGLRKPNIFFDNCRDSLSFGYAEIWIEDLPSEIAWELAYAVKICPKLLMTPDMQIIQRPSGVHNLAWVFSLRLAYTI
jgi:porin